MRQDVRRGQEWPGAADLSAWGVPITDSADKRRLVVLILRGLASGPLVEIVFEECDDCVVASGRRTPPRRIGVGERLQHQLALFGYQCHKRVESGYFSRSLNTYGRAGQPCNRCGTPIRRESFMNRSSHFCPVCQRRR